MTPVVIDPERQFLGCLMQLATAPARSLLAGMQATDLSAPVAADVLQLAIELVAGDQAPAPLALLDRAWETTDMRPWTGGSHRLQNLGRWIAETYHHAPSAPAAAGAWLKTLVLKAAWRRAIREHGLRLIQAIEQECSTDSVYQLADETSRVDDLWRRYQAARNAIGESNRLEVVA